MADAYHIIGVDIGGTSTVGALTDLLGYPGEIEWGLATETIARSPMLQTIDGMLDQLSLAGTGRDGVLVSSRLAGKYHASPGEQNPQTAGCTWYGMLCVPAA